MTQVIKPLIFEEWKPFVYDKVTPGMYEVSNIGRVRNNKGQITVRRRGGGHKNKF